MKKIYMTLLAALIFATSGFTQLTGTKNIPGAYPDLASAITDLNAQGVGAGGVTFNLLAGNPQTAPAGGYVIGNTGSLVLTTTSAANPVIIQGNANTVTASAALSAGALNDAIFKLIGADWITLKGFTLQENAANTTTAAATNNMTEWGVALLYVTTTDGAQNNTIQGNTITLNKTYQNSFGIYSNSTHSATSVTTTATATTTAGGNNALKVYSNNISNVNNGIVVVGPTAAADQNTGIEIGGTAANANTITDYGTNGTFSSYANVSQTINGILVRNSYGFTISNNTVTSSNGSVTAGTLNGIQVPAASNAPTATFTNLINNNIISLRSGVTAGAINGINYPSGSASATSTVNINGNDFNTFGHTVAGASGTIIFIAALSANQFTTISNNTFTNISVNTTGSVTFISQGFSMPASGTQTFNNNAIVTAFNKSGAGGTITCFTTGTSSPNGTSTSYTNNNFSNITVTGATGITGITNSDGAGTSPTKIATGNTFSNWTGGTSSITCISISYIGAVTSSISSNTLTNITGQSSITGITIGSSFSGATTLNIASNTVSNLTSTGSGGTVSGIACSNVSTTVNINNNAVNTLSSTGTSSAITAISVTGAATTNVFKNKVYNLLSTGVTPLVSGILVSSGTTVNVYNNIIGDLKATAGSNTTTDIIRGINLTSSSSSSTLNVSYNTVYLNATGGANFTTSGIYHTYSSTATTASLVLRNNIITNASTPSGTGLTIAFRRSASTDLNNYATSSNNNLFYTSASPDASHLIYYDGTNSDQTLAAFKTRVAPRESNSISELPPFASTTGSAANFLHLTAGATTGIESGAVNLAGIPDDIDNDVRQGNAGYAGSGSAPDIGADEFEGRATGTPCTAPADQASGLIMSAITATGATGNFTAAPSTPSGYLVVRSVGTLSGNPANGTSYNPGNTFANGTVVQSGPTTTFTATGLAGNTTYTFTVISFNSAGCIGGPVYNNTNPLTGTATTCPSTPAGLNNSAITTSSFQLNYTTSRGGGSAGVTYNLEVTTDAGFATPIPGSPFTFIDTTTTQTVMSYTVSGLNPSTTYYYRIKANGCNTGTATGSVVTSCNAISTFPWTEGFEGVSTVGAGILPTCWSYANITGTNSPGTYAANDTYREPHTGSKLMYTQYNTTAWAFTPGFTLTAGTSYDFSFWMKNKLVTSPVDFVMDVAYGTSPGAASMTNSLQSGYNANNSAWTLFKYTFTPPANGTYYFGIKSTSTSTTPWYLSFDDFTVDLTPSCAAPSAVTAGSITATSASIGFTCTSCSGSYIVEYGLPGFTPGTGTTAGTGGTVVTGAASPISISGLTAATTYDVYVRQNCGAGSVSANSIKATFNTLCQIASLPLNEGFNNPTIPICWSRQFVTNSLDFQYTASSGGTPNPTPFEGSRMVWFNSYSNSGSQTRLVSPQLKSTGTSSVDVNFEWYHYSTGGAGSYLTEGVQVQYSTDGTTWTDAGSLIRRYDPVNGWALKTVTLPAAAGNQASLYVGFLFTSNAGYDSYLDAVAINATPACVAPTGVSVGTITQTSAVVTFSSPGASVLEYGPTGFTPGTGATPGVGGTVIDPATSPQSISGLTGSSVYDVYVRQNCIGAGAGYSPNSAKVTFSTLIVNDDAPGAITLTVGAGCTGTPYTNLGATQSAGEPFASCKGTAGFNSVWYKFVAPTGGAVRISDDYSGGSFGTDSRIALFSATDPADYTTFSIISCDDDNGSVVGARSVLYATGLTAGTTYYIQVDGYSSSTTQGTFCVTVDALTSAMLSTTGSCVAGQGIIPVSNYKGWLSLTDPNSNLVALVRDNAGSGVNFDNALTVNTGAGRTYGGFNYLNRNYRITSTATNVDVQFFFLNTELSALTTADGTTLNTLGANRQTETVSGCYPNFSNANGTVSFLSQNGNGTVNGVSWISVLTPGFSNFYLSKVSAPLPVIITTFNANRNGTVNSLTWSTSQEINTSMFVVERSTDGRNFTTIGQVAAAGNSSSLRSYQFTDAAPAKAINYYRLRIVDRDNNARFSDVRNVKNTGNADFTIYPNPVKDLVKIDINADRNDKGVMIITDINGKQVYSRQVNVAAGNNTFSIDVSNMANGAYIIKVQLTDDLAVKKFTKL